MSDKKNIIVSFFDENILNKISEILFKNGIEESPEEAAFKDTSFMDIVLKLSKDIASQKILEENAISLIKEKLNVADAVAKNILKDINEKIIPLAERNEINEYEKKINANPEIIRKSFKKTNTIVENFQPVQEKKKKDVYRETIE